MRATLLWLGCVLPFCVGGTAGAQTDPETVERPTEAQIATEEVSLAYLEADERPEEPRTWQDRKWSFLLAPYLMFPFMNGSLTLADQTLDVNVNTRDLLKRLDWGLMLYFEARHPKFSVVTDLLYMNLKDGAQLPVSGRDAGLRMQQLAAEIVVLGRIVEWFELGAGGRVNFVQSDLTVPGGTILPPVNLDFRETWFDPIIVVRFSVPFVNDHWRLGLRADFGGFTLGSQYAWQAYTYGGYNFDGIKGRRLFELGLAFRALGMKYETGSGRDRFVYDMIIWGPEIGFLFHF